MLKRFSTNGKTGYNALSIAAAALLALALGVGANSGIIGLSQFTPANNSLFCREGSPLAGRQLMLMRSTMPQRQRDEPAQSTDSAFQSFDLRFEKATGTTLLYRRIFAGRRT
ncbi:MAG TPA: hypothetical protein VF131_24170 [Blastocatellia bacterium]|nr:hypothetical protein [Blastocatellia bacterium]